MTATVETVIPEQLDLAPIMPTERVVSAVARSITLSDADVGKCSHHMFRFRRQDILKEMSLL